MHLPISILILVPAFLPPKLLLWSRFGCLQRRQKSLLKWYPGWLLYIISYWENSLLKYCARWLLYNFDFADSDLSLYIFHIVPFVCCIIHVSSILVDCCMTYIILEKSLLKYCAHWLLYNFDFDDSDLSLYIVHIVPFVCCIIHVTSILVDCCIDIYHIGKIPIEILRPLIVV